MSHKKKTRPAARPVASADAAGSPARAGHFKESIERFKELLKQERRAEWLDGLAAAYTGRAEQLAAKGMVNEALALWRTRAEACKVPLLDGPYIGWLLQVGQTQQALALLPQLATLPEAARERARTRLAPAMLTAPDSLLACLPEDERRSCAAARAALAACTRGDAAALDAALPAISFRSPYRDLRPLLRAMSVLGADRAGAAAALARVPPGGPFEALAAALRVCLLPRSEWLAAWRKLDDAGRTLVLELQGCPPAQRAFLLELAARVDAAATPPADLLDLLLRCRRDLPERFSRHYALRLLPHAVQRLDALRAASLAPTAADEERVRALAAELKQRPEVAETHWLRLVDLLARAPKGSPRAALVLRRLADAHSDHTIDGVLCKHAQALLTRGLQLDPSDLDAAMRLIRSARADGDLKQARQWLDAARERFPEDTSLLLEAVEVALAAGSFKKAAGLAKQVLQSDPINPRVRSLIGQAHLSHARKQIGSRNPAAAQRELDEAANWLRSSSERGVLALLRGLAAEPAASGDVLLREAVVELGGPLIGAFHLLLEARRAKHQAAAPVDLLRRAGIELGATPVAADVVAFARALHDVPLDDAALRAAIGGLQGMLERAAARVEFSESELLLVCEALHRHHLGPLTRRFAAAALRHWPQRPVFVYLDAAARYGSAPWTMPQREWERLEQVSDQAQDQGDQRSATRLRRLLGDADLGSRAPWPGAPDDFDDGPVTGIEQMINEMSDQGRFLEIARQQLGGAILEELQRDSKGDKERLFRAMSEALAAGLAAGGLGAGAGPPARPRPRKAAGESGRPAPRQKGLFDD
jgi:tetratricopeptide (TPR) repeat protein